MSHTTHPMAGAPRLDDEDRRLRQVAERAILRQIIWRLEDAELTPEQVNKLAQTYCELKKQDVAAEKNDVMRESRRAGIAARHAPATNRLKPDDEAPYGRHDDGTPVNRMDFLKNLRVAVRDIYGVETPDDPAAPHNRKPPAALNPHGNNSKNKPQTPHSEPRTPHSEPRTSVRADPQQPANHHQQAANSFTLDVPLGCQGPFTRTFNVASALGDSTNPSLDPTI